MAVGNEQIDVRILRLLELEDVFDIDYDTYLILLKEAMVKGSFGKDKMPDEELALLANERKRIRGKKGRFSVKKKSPITADKLGIGKSFRISQKQLALPPAAITPKDSEDDTEVLKNIDDLLRDIRDNLIGLDESAKEKGKLDKKEKEDKKRKEREEKLEKKPFQAIKNIADKIITPVKSLFQRLFDFIGKIILGRVLFKIVEWFGNPENHKKVDSIVRFLKDWWPALLGTYILFGTRFGKFVRTISRIVIRSVPMLLSATKNLLKFIGKRPVLAAAAAAAAGIGAYVMSQRNEEYRDESKKTDSSIVTPKEVGKTPGVPQLQQEQALQGGLGAMFNGGGLVFPRQQFNNGGQVRGPGGVDRVPAWLTNGEFVMSKGAVEKFGINTLESMNAAGGGTNVPTVVDNEMYAQGGGYIGKDEPPKSGLRPEIKEKSSKVSESNIRKEWSNIFNNIDHPLYYKAVSDPSYNYVQFKKDFLANQSVKSKSSYKPYVSRFAGARDRAHERASRIRGSRPYVNPFSPGGMYGGPRMLARTDYAASKGKYYSSSDQKTYGNYNDAMAAKRSRMTSLASQQRLDKLSSQGAGPRTGRGIRYTAEAKAQTREDIKRGGFMGQLGRLGTRMFGGEEGRRKLAAQDAASAARVKQAGAASIGRYYSSSDGKYYKDYNAAVLAKKQRLKSGVKPPVKSKPKYSPAGGGMGGARGSGSKPSTAKNVPSGSASMPGGTRRAQATLGIKK